MLQRSSSEPKNLQSYSFLVKYTEFLGEEEGNLLLEGYLLL